MKNLDNMTNECCNKIYMWVYLLFQSFQQISSEFEVTGGNHRFVITLSKSSGIIATSIKILWNNGMVFLQIVTIETSVFFQRLI